MRPSRITFTGIDPSCSRAELFALLNANRRIELGILYSESQQGKGRYPPFAWIERTTREITDAYGTGRVALHVCGRARDSLLKGNGLAIDVWPFDRIQLNGTFVGGDIDALQRYIVDGEPEPLITQFDANRGLHEIVRRKCHQVLFDSSGGRGVLRKEWPKALPDNICGYAGGLGPENLRVELPRIAAVAGPNYWVDMEGSLRDEADHFCVGKARRALDAILAAESSAVDAASVTGQAPRTAP